LEEEEGEGEEVDSWPGSEEGRKEVEEGVEIAHFLSS
jgi:hypothetical protein